MKKIISMFLILFTICIPVIADDTFEICTMYSRYDGAAIQVYKNEIPIYAKDYANPDETVSVYSREDGAEIKLWSYEVAGYQDKYATGRQTITMYSKIDEMKITIWAYDAMNYSNGYYGEFRRVYSLDGRISLAPSNDIDSWKNVGWYNSFPYIGKEVWITIYYLQYM